MAEKIFIGGVATVVNRRVNTIRGWDRAGKLPEHLRSHRDNANGRPGWRYWTEEQVKGIVQWMHDERVFPGAGLPHFQPSAEQIDEMITNLRVAA
jgi:hypothetical protein